MRCTTGPPWRSVAFAVVACLASATPVTGSSGAKVTATAKATASSFEDNWVASKLDLLRRRTSGAQGDPLNRDDTATVLEEAEKWRTGTLNYTADGARAYSLYWTAASGSGPAAASALNHLAWLHVLPPKVAYTLLTATSPPPTTTTQPNHLASSFSSTNGDNGNQGDSDFSGHSWSAPPPSSAASLSTPSSGGDSLAESVVSGEGSGSSSSDGSSWGTTSGGGGGGGELGGVASEVASGVGSGVGWRVGAWVAGEVKDLFGVDLAEFWLVQLGRRMGWWSALGLAPSHEQQQQQQQWQQHGQHNLVGWDGGGGGEDEYSALISALQKERKDVAAARENAAAGAGSGEEGSSGGAGRRSGGGGKRVAGPTSSGTQVALALWRASAERGSAAAQHALATHLASPAFLGASSSSSSSSSSESSGESSSETAKPLNDIDGDGGGGDEGSGHGGRGESTGEYESIVRSVFASLGGSLAAQMSSGHRHLFGHGVPASCEQAKPFYELASNQAVASFRALAGHYPGQVALPPSDDLAVRLSKSTAPGGGRGGGKESDREVVQYYEAAALTGDANAALQLGNFYLNGVKGCEQNLRTASRLFQRALDLSTAKSSAEQKKKKKASKGGFGAAGTGAGAKAAGRAGGGAGGDYSPSEEAAALEEMSEVTAAAFKLKKIEVQARTRQAVAAAEQLRTSESAVRQTHERAKAAQQGAAGGAKQEASKGSEEAAVAAVVAEAAAAEAEAKKGFETAKAEHRRSLQASAVAQALLKQSNTEARELVFDALSNGFAPKAEAAAAAGILGVMAFGGIGGVQRSEVEALKLFTLGARGPNGGDPISLTGLGIMHAQRSKPVIEMHEESGGDDGGDGGGATVDGAGGDDNDARNNDDEDDDASIGDDSGGGGGGVNVHGRGKLSSSGNDDDDDDDSDGVFRAEVMSKSASDAKAFEYFEEAAKRGYMEGFYHLGMFHLAQAEEQGNTISELQVQFAQHRLASQDTSSSSASSSPPSTSASASALRRSKQQRAAKLAAAAEGAKKERATGRERALERRQAKRRAESARRKQQRQRDAKKEGLFELDGASEAAVEAAESEAAEREEQEYHGEAVQEEGRIDRDANSALHEDEQAASLEASLAHEEAEVKQRGKTVAAHLQKAFQSLSTSAQHGHVLAAHQLGVLYSSGRGVAPSCATAVTAFKAVAERSFLGTRLATSALELWRAGDVQSSRLVYAALAEMGFEVGQSNAAWLLEHAHLLKPGAHTFLQAVTSGLRALFKQDPPLTGGGGGGGSGGGQVTRTTAAVASAAEWVLGEGLSRALFPAFGLAIAPGEHRDSGDGGGSGSSTSLTSSSSTSSSTRAEVCGALDLHACEEAALRLWRLAATQKNAEAALKVGDYAYYGKGVHKHTHASRDQGDDDEGGDEVGDGNERGDNEGGGNGAAPAAPSDSASSPTLGTGSSSPRSSSSSGGEEGWGWRQWQWWYLPPAKGDAVAAARHYQAAADLHHPQALWNLGWMYQWGVGVPVDRHLSKRHFDSAAELLPEAAWPSFLGLVSLQVSELLLPVSGVGSSSSSSSDRSSFDEKKQQRKKQQSRKRSSSSSSDGGGSGGVKEEDAEANAEEYDWGDEFKEQEDGNSEGLVGWFFQVLGGVFSADGASFSSSAAPSSALRSGGGLDDGFDWRDELLAFDTLVVLALTTALLLVHQLRRHQRDLYQQLNNDDDNNAAEDSATPPVTQAGLQGEGQQQQQQQQRGGGVQLGGQVRQRHQQHPPAAAAAGGAPDVPPQGGYGVPLDE